MKVRANGDKVLVKVEKNEKVTASGIIIPGTNAEKRNYSGIVVNVGNDPAIKDYDIKPGDYVIYDKGSNYEVEIDGELHDLVSVFDINAVGVNE